jgi:hypothetical protein
LGTVGAGSEAIARAGSEAIAPYQPPPWYLMTVEAIVEAIFRRLIPMVPVQAPVVERSPGTRLAHLRELEKAYERGFCIVFLDDQRHGAIASMIPEFIDW